METAVLHYRYPGSRPFQDTNLDRRLFFGREHETQLLLHTVLAERLTVLFAKSGMGKTSLLNAGIMQLLREKNFFPFKVRFNTPEMSPLQTIYEGIKRSIHQENGEYDPQKTLLEYFQTFEFASLDLWASEEVSLTPVVILDQFEEFFTLHAPENRQTFTQQLADLVKHRNQEIKILLSIREDFLGHLEEIAKELPEIFQNRFRISALTREQARKAIEEPARIDNALLSTTKFHYAPEAVETMLDFLCRQRKQGEFILSDEVEPFQLQLLCQYIEQMVCEHSEKEESLIIVQKDQLGGETGMQQILENFYDYQIGQLDSDLKKRRICNLCEHGLISISNRRLSLEEEDIEIRFNVTKDILTKLVDSRLLRAEPRVGSVYYELSHDTLIEPIRNSQKRRQVRQSSVLADVQKLYQEAGQSEIEGNLDIAIQKYQKVIELDKTFVKAYIELGQLHAEQGRLAEAVKIYQKAIDFGIENATIYYQLGKSLNFRGAIEEAIESYYHAIMLDPNLSIAYIELGKIYTQQKKYTDAITQYEKALSLDEQNANIYNELSILYIQQNEAEQAINLYRKAIQIHVDYAYIYHPLNEAFQKIGRPDLSEKVCELASQVSSKDASYYFNLGEDFYELGKYQKAVEFYYKTIELDPEFTEAYNNMGNALAKQGQYSEATKCFQKALDAKPNDAVIFNNIGLSLNNLGNYLEAIKFFQKAIELDSMYAAAHSNLGNAFANKKEYDKAIMEYRKAIECNPSYVYAYNNLGLALTKKGQYRQAISYFHKALDLDPKYKNAYYNLGLTFSVQGKYHEAITQYQKALELDPQNIEVYHKLGLAYAKQGQYDKASEYYCKALELDPNDAVSFDMLGSIHFKQGQYNEALANWNSAIRYFPKNIRIRMNIIEVTLLTDQFDKTLILVKEMLSRQHISVDYHLSLQFILLSTLIFQGKRNEAFKQLTQLLDYYKNLTEEYARGWSYADSKFFIKQTEKLLKTEKTLLLSLIEILESPKSQGDKKFEEFELLFREWGKGN